MRGWKFSKTRLSDEYTFDAFKADLPEDGMIIALMVDNDDVDFVAADAEPEPGPGTTILYFAKDRDPQQPASEDDE